MDLNEQAKRAVDELFAEFGAENDARSARTLVWLDGYEKGVAATKAKLNDAFAQWQAAQS